MAGGGTQNAQPPQMPQMGPPQMPQRGGGNVYDRAAGALQGAVGGTNAAMGYQPMQVGGAGYSAAQLSGANLRPYQNPYTQQVINGSMRDLNRARQMTLNDVGAQATSAGAFGGDRHGLVEAQANADYMRRAGDLSANLNNQNFMQAQSAAMSDVNARNQQRAFNAGNSLQAQLANQSAGLTGNSQRIGAAGQLGNLANLGFGFGQQINADQASQGAQQQAMMQAIINAAQGRFQGFTGSPGQSLSYPLAAIGAAPVPQSAQTSQNPGIFNYLALGLGLL